MQEFYITIAKRFSRAFLAGFTASAILIVPGSITNYHDLNDWLFALSLAGIIGGITGLLQAIDKALRYKE